MSYNSRLTILWAAHNSAHNSGLPPHGAVIMSARPCHNIVRTEAFPSDSFHILSWCQYFLWTLYHICLCARITTSLGLGLFRPTVFISHLDLVILPSRICIIYLLDIACLGISCFTCVFFHHPSSSTNEAVWNIVPGWTLDHKQSWSHFLTRAV